jgi:CRP/FNR family transcriptional regulator, anaerobic regulatory protein
MLHLLEAYCRNLIPKLTDEAWNWFASVTKVVQVKKGYTLIKEGQICNHVFFINTGLVRVYNLTDGKENVQGFIAENEFISEYPSFLTRKPSTLYIEMIEDGELVITSYDDIQHAYDKFPIFERLGRKIAEYLFIEFNAHVTALYSSTAEQRYIKFVAEDASLANRIPQYMLASYLGVTPEHLSRIRKKLTTKSVYSN